VGRGLSKSLFFHFSREPHPPQPGSVKTPIRQITISHRILLTTFPQLKVFPGRAIDYKARKYQGLINLID
jgi:hypothetical protein